MPKLVWGAPGKRLYEVGVDRAVLFVKNVGYAWDGMQKVTESPEGGEETALYAANTKYLSLFSAEVLKGTIEAYTYPDSFEACDGSEEVAPGVTIGQQDREPFAMSYRSFIGNDEEGNQHGYKLHIIYGMKASPSERARGTINDSPEALTFSWGFSSTPVNAGERVTSSIVIDSTKAPKEQLEKLEEMLYGTAAVEPKLPTPDEVVTMMTLTPPVGG